MEIRKKLTPEQFNVLYETFKQYVILDDKLKTILICLEIPFHAIFTLKFDTKNNEVIYEEPEGTKKEN